MKPMSDLSAKPKPSHAPVYCAAMYPELAEIFRKHGYALTVHGSLQRDLDLIAIPWVEVVSEPQAVLDEVLSTFAVNTVGVAGHMPHGRTVYTIAVGFGTCAFDIGFMPAIKESESANDRND